MSRIRALISTLVLALAFPAVSFAGSCFLANKDRETKITIKRAGSRVVTSVAARATMEIPGTPLTIVLSNGKSIEALDGETITLRGGKLSKPTVPVDEAEAPPAESAPPAAAAEASAPPPAAAAAEAPVATPSP